MRKIEEKITITTKPNGYALTVNEKEYLYFNTLDLVKGVCIHVGLGRKSPTTKYGRDAILKAMGDGSLERKLQKEVNELKSQVFNLKNALHESKEEQKRNNGQEGLYLM